MGLTVVKKQRADFDLAARMKELGKIGVLVGIPSDRTARDGESVTSSELLYLHTHGIRRKAMRQEMDKDVEEDDEENTQEILPGAVESALPEFKDAPQTGDNAISNMGDEAYLKKIEEEEEKEKRRIEKEKEEGLTDDEE